MLCLKAIVSSWFSRDPVHEALNVSKRSPVHGSQLFDRGGKKHNDIGLNIIIRDAHRDLARLLRTLMGSEIIDGDDFSVSSAISPNCGPAKLPN